MSLKGLAHSGKLLIWELPASLSTCCTSQCPALAFHSWPMRDLMGDSRWLERVWHVAAAFDCFPGLPYPKA